MNSGKDEPMDSSPDPFESTFRNVASRPAPPAAVEQAVYQHALQDWKQLRTSKKRGKRIVYWSLAASVLMALLIGPLFIQLPGISGETDPLGLVENQRGSVTLVQGNEHIQLAAGNTSSPLFPAQSLLTAANSGVSINWGRGTMVRVAQNTELHLNSSTEIELVSGKIYVDIPTGPGGAPSKVDFNVVTRFGSVSHVGTQFMVTSDAAQLQVKVREGAVAIDNDKQVIVTHKGQQTTLDNADGVSHESILTYGPDWQWAEQLAPTLVLEGKTLNDFLTWVGRESGKEILFDTKTAEEIADRTVMHGSVDQAPLLALNLVLQTNELSWREEDGIIHLSAQQ